MFFNYQEVQPPLPLHRNFTMFRDTEIAPCPEKKCMNPAPYMLGNICNIGVKYCPNKGYLDFVNIGAVLEKVDSI